MARVSIATVERAPITDLPEGFAGGGETRTLFGGNKDLFQVLVHRIARDAVLHITPQVIDVLGFVWRGRVEAGGRPLEQGSSLIVEHGAVTAIKGVDESPMLVTFAARHSPAKPRLGGHVHLLPRERVPRIPSMGGASGISGGMHADAACPTCELWLHENHFPPIPAAATGIRNAGLHSHTEDEVIFVTDGQMQLGARAYGPGAAIAIAADTLYSFNTGSEGLSFVNFRAALPREVHFPDGRVMDETAIWRTGLSAALVYLAPQAD